jgi:hypothetical protein
MTKIDKLGDDKVLENAQNMGDDPKKSKEIKKYKTQI